MNPNPATKSRRRSASVFTAFGIVDLAFSALLLLSVLANRQTAIKGGHNLSGAIGPSIILIIVGCGLLMHWRWAAVLFGALCGVIGVCLSVGSILIVTFPFLLLNVLYGVLLVGAAIITYRNWSTLT